MKRQIIAILILIFATLQMWAQKVEALQQRTAEQTRCAEYKRVARKILKDDELLVMFYMDAALVVDPNADTQIVKQIKTENPWESLKEYLYDKSDIYFCPSGSQLSVAIEYMPCPLDDNTTMSSQFGMYRLSSPEELFKNRGESFRSIKHKAVVYGGLNYDAKRKIKEPLLAFNRSRGSDGYGELKNAEAEALYIDSLMRKQNVEVALMSGENGSEKSFYKIPSTKADILHIASHGEYQPNEDNLDSQSLEEWMMSHSALILSGYNTPSSKANDDGKLTAYEISQTDLSHIKLAVLSVCESAKGDIKENEVYGLLKGFKMAGAGTLLLTLDTVNDDITKMLMIRFYENLFRGNDPRSALESAQRYLIRFLARYDKGKYKDSEEWKKFILVDDLDRNIGQNVTDEERQYFLDEIVGLRELYTTTKLLGNWDIARKKMKEQDKFVRFFSYIVADGTNKSVKYMALVGDAKSGKRTLTPLFTINESNIPEYEFFLNHVEKWDSIVWKPIMNEIKNCNHLYFQTTGILNNMPIECFPSVVDAYKTYRISSLNALSDQKHTRKNNGELALFGGLYYDYDETEIKKATTPLTRGPVLGLSYLPGTLTEVNYIDSIAKETGYSALKFTGYLGTETNLKEVVKRENLIGIHIATHAYASEEILNYSRHYSIYGYLLSNTAIFLSGVYDNINGMVIDNDEEGILTGADITKFDLHDLDFVALSMCEANRGLPSNINLIASDYNWSLTYAFKKAGVKTILGSTSPIDDEATSRVMMLFYENWLRKKMTLRDALESARKTIRSTKGWEDPKYWASFILIDGLD